MASQKIDSHLYKQSEDWSNISHIFGQIRVASYKTYTEDFKVTANCKQLKNWCSIWFRSRMVNSPARTPKKSSFQTAQSSQTKSCQEILWSKLTFAGKYNSPQYYFFPITWADLDSSQSNQAIQISHRHNTAFSAQGLTLPYFLQEFFNHSNRRERCILWC